MEMEIINGKLHFKIDPWRGQMMQGIKKIWVLKGMNFQIVDKSLTLAMKIMVLTGPLFETTDHHLQPRQ
jgi:hypothetical protein